MDNIHSMYELLKGYKSEIIEHKELANTCHIDLSLFLKAETHLNNIQKVLNEIFEAKDNYKNQIINDCLDIIQSLGDNHKIKYLDVKQGEATFVKSYYAETLPYLENAINKAEFNLELFRKFSFFNRNIVAIGANGSGKSSLSQKLKDYLPESAMTISAQKLLIIPVFKNINNPNDTQDELQKSQSLGKSSKFKYQAQNGFTPAEVNQLKDEFKIILDHLLSENNTLTHEAVRLATSGEEFKPPLSKLSKVISLWNSLIEHRTLTCNDGINITLIDEVSGNVYPAYQMSDGEKVVLYYIAHVLLAPKDGFIIVDEPEMYLHKTLLNKLWDIVETKREDCIFIYLTHDLEFAISRNTAKKVWIKSFIYPDKWEIEEIPTNDLPEALLLKLLGSRKRILFCEGEIGSIDEKIYNLLLPNFTITPVSSCSDVINYTKAFNALTNITTEAFGLIDSDYQDPKRLNKLKGKNIFSLEVSEIENLLFDEDFLKALSKQMMCDEEIVSDIKNDVLKQLLERKELQVANYISAKINHYFKDSHVSKGNTLTDVKAHYEQFTNIIDIEEWYNVRSDKVQAIIDSQDYENALLVVNDKGLKTIANKHFNIGNFQERAINYLQFNRDCHQFFLKYFPSELTQHG